MAGFFFLLSSLLSFFFSTRSKRPINIRPGPSRFLSHPVGIRPISTSSNSPVDKEIDSEGDSYRDTTRKKGVEERDGAAYGIPLLRDSLLSEPFHLLSTHNAYVTRGNPSFDDRDSVASLLRLRGGEPRVTNGGGGIHYAPLIPEKYKLIGVRTV